MKHFAYSAMKPLLGDTTALIDQVRAVCQRLADAGWADLFKLHGLDIAPDDLATELARPLDGIDRRQPGFEDFALEANRGVEPGMPAHSLLFHAFASPQVTTWRSSDGKVPLKDFPTPAEIEVVENYVYGVEPPSIEDLRVRAGNAHLAIVVVAAEYRPAIATVHRKYADMCYARTGVARVGTREPEYLADARGYLPFVDGDGRVIRVLPCRYSAYIAALLPSHKDGHGPMRFIDEDGKPSAAAPGRRTSDAGLKEVPQALRNKVGDTSRSLWIPLHKLFDGAECIRGRRIQVRLSANHLNEKIRRAHLRFLASGHFAGWSEPDVSESPFIFRSGIAEFSTHSEDGSWLLVPSVHPHLAERAEYKGKPLTYLVPESKAEGGPWRAYKSSLNLLPQPSGARAAPEYLHARHAIEPDGTERDYNKQPGVRAVVSKGGYRARHYVDYTGDGWIDVECSDLALEIPRRLPAYSIVASPDFFPLVQQADLMQWTDQSVPPSLLKIIWTAPGAGQPNALSDQRYAANLQLPGAEFDAADDTMTAIVGHYGSGQGQLTRIDRLKNWRASMLTDSAAGVFAPGWDVSYDRTTESDPLDTGESLQPGVTFLTNYGLGSPFVEDSKLCAALSSFWPAVAPDVTRTFEPGRSYATATPLTDDDIGLGSSEPWDGIKGPTVDHTKKVVEYTSIDYGDYVQAALDDRFNIATIGQTGVEEYLARTSTMALVYEGLGVTSNDEKVLWTVLSFKPVEDGDPDLARALEQTGRQINRSFAYRYEMFQHGRGESRPSDDPAKFDKRLVDFKELVLIFADPSIVFLRDNEGRWSVHELHR